MAFSQNKGLSKRLALKKELNSDAGNSAVKLRLARQYLAEAEFEKAQGLVEEVIEAQPQHGEAHYVLGLVLGFQDDFEASDKSIARARELGYQP